MPRTLIRDLQLANPVYALARVTAYGVTGGGAKDTSDIITLYPAESGTDVLPNPQILNSNGQFKQPVYADVACILEVAGPHVGSHDTGIIRPDTASATSVIATGSTSLRTLADRFGGFVNVKDHGAVGDYNPTTQTGTNDDTAFTAAIAASGTKTIYLPEGNYLLTNYPAYDVRIIGPGRIYLNASKDIQGQMIGAGVSEGIDGLRRGGFAIGADGPGPNFALLGSGGNPAWTKMRPSREGTHLQVQHYSSAYVGIGTAVSGTGFIDIVTGIADLTTNDDIEVDDLFAFADTEYKVKTKVSASRIEVKNLDNSAVSFASSFTDTFCHVYQYNEGTCDTNGTAVQRVSGDYFDGLGDLAAPGVKITINSVDYTLVSRTDKDNLVIGTSAGVQTGVAFKKKDITSERKTVALNLQHLAGANEENFNIFIDNRGRVYFRPGIAGSGTNRRLIVKGAANPDDANKDHVVFHPDGQTLFGDDTPSLNPSVNRAKLETFRHVSDAMTAGGNVIVRHLRMRSSFNGTDFRNLDFGFYNDFGGGFIKSAGNQRILIQDGGGDVGIGFKDTTTFRLEIEGDFGPHTDALHDIGSAALQFVIAYLSTGVNVGGNNVVRARQTGYTNAMTGTADRATSYATSTITLQQLAERVKALQDDLTTHGLIGV